MLTTERFFLELPKGLFPDMEQIARQALAGSADDLHALMTAVYLRGKRHGRDAERARIQQDIRAALMLDRERVVD